MMYGKLVPGTLIVLCTFLLRFINNLSDVSIKHVASDQFLTKEHQLSI